MYNLLVSYQKHEWGGGPLVLPPDRCVKEYTDKAITSEYGGLDDAAVRALKRMPCIFAHEAKQQIDPSFGHLTDVRRRTGSIILDYKIVELPQFLTADQLAGQRVALDIAEWELERTHWAVKDVNLAIELERLGVSVPGWVLDYARLVDIDTHEFDVAFSFPGEHRDLVAKVVAHLEPMVGPDAYFYDRKYAAQLARPSMDLLLEEIYRDRSRLVVVFICASYQAKEWCGLEFRVIKERILGRQNRNIMYIRLDDGEVDGVLKTDGYLQADSFSPEEIARAIHQRIQLLDASDSNAI